VNKTILQILTLVYLLSMCPSDSVHPCTPHSTSVSLNTRVLDVRNVSTGLFPLCSRPLNTLIGRVMNVTRVPAHANWHTPLPEHRPCGKSCQGDHKTLRIQNDRGVNMYESRARAKLTLTLPKALLAHHRGGIGWYRLLWAVGLLQEPSLKLYWSSWREMGGS